MRRIAICASGLLAAALWQACDDDGGEDTVSDAGVDAPFTFDGGGSGDVAALSDGPAAAGSDAGGDGAPVPDAVAEACDPLPKLKLVKLAQAANAVMALTQAEGDERLFIAERAGRIRIIKNGQLQDPPFLDMRPSIAFIAQTHGERGLINLALHPDFANNGRFFVYYTASRDDPFSDGLEGDVVVAEGRRSAEDPERAEPSLKPLLVIEHSEDHPRNYDDGHNGGLLAFGPDGQLYTAVGDGGHGYDDFRTGQDADHPLAKMYRIDVDAPPADPHDAASVRFAMGVRNPWRGSFDRETGDLYFGDVGEGLWEEINVVPAGAAAGRNYGWGNPGMEGTHCFPPTVTDCDPVGVAPLHEYEHPRLGARRVEARAVVAGFVYRGSDIPGLRGRFLFGDYSQNKVFSLTNKDGRASCVHDHTADVTAGAPLRGLLGFGEDARGEAYLFDLFGNIYALALASPAAG